MTRRLPASLFAICCALLPLAAQVSPNGPAISPFRGMRATATGLEVQVDGDTWYGLESVHGVDVGTLLRESRRLCGDSWWKRVTEDLPALLDAMGHPVAGTAVDLQLTDLASGKLVERRAVPMTGDNRRRLWHRNQAVRGAPALPAPAAATLTAALAAADLDALQQLLDTQFAYRQLRQVDLPGLIAASKRRLGSGEVGREALLAEVEVILRAFGDGHTRLSEASGGGGPYLPFLVQQTAAGHAAFFADRSALLDPARPFVLAIDGVPLARWLEAAAGTARPGSTAMQARDAERGLRELGALRRQLGLAAGPRVAVTVGAADGEPRELLLAVAERKPIYGSWPRGQSRVLEGNVGYLRLPGMASDAAFLDGIDAAMQQFKDTKALVVDVRGNGGGSRDALRRLFPYLLADGEAPQVVNAAAVLLSTVDDATADDLLADRGMHRADWQGWSQTQRQAVTAFARGFQPQWQLPRGRFSPLHFLVLDRSDNARAFAYRQPVRVLIDNGCFSATDIFVAALRTRPQVQLCGSATSGGSGRARPHALPHSKIRVQLSSMASFRPDGRLFEGNGCEPDLACEPAPGDLVGLGDAVLQRALESLR